MVLAQHEENGMFSKFGIFVDALLQVSNAIREGAEGYFATQYGTIAKMTMVLGGIIFFVYLFRRATQEQLDAGITR